MPEIPTVPGVGTRTSDRSLAQRTLDAFAPGGALARVVPGFEAREGQVQMAAAVADVFTDDGVLLAETGTGTGKTLAYLIPAILSGKRMLVSTGTKNL